MSSSPISNQQLIQLKTRLSTLEALVAQPAEGEPPSSRGAADLGLSGRADVGLASLVQTLQREMVAVVEEQRQVQARVRELEAAVAERDQKAAAAVAAASIESEALEALGQRLGAMEQAAAVEAAENLERDTRAAEEMLGWDDALREAEEKLQAVQTTVGALAAAAPEAEQRLEAALSTQRAESEQRLEGALAALRMELAAERTEQAAALAKLQGQHTQLARAQAAEDPEPAPAEPTAAVGAEAFEALAAQLQALESTVTSDALGWDESLTELGLRVAATESVARAEHVDLRSEVDSLAEKVAAQTETQAASGASWSGRLDALAERVEGLSAAGGEVSGKLEAVGVAVARVESEQAEGRAEHAALAQRVGDLSQHGEPHTSPPPPPPPPNHTCDLHD